jgi:hypothetical protein
MRRTATVAALASIWIMAVSGPYAQTPSSQPSYKTFEICFADDSQVVGRDADGQARRPVVVIHAEAQRWTRGFRPRGPIDFFDLYRRELAGIGVASVTKAAAFAPNAAASICVDRSGRADAATSRGR